MIVLSACGIEPHSPQERISAPTVFYPRYQSEQCNEQTRKGSLIVNFKPDWNQSSYDLHSLRFLDCLTKRGAKGDLKSLEIVKQVVLDWNAKNNFAQKTKKWSWKDNHGAHEEHGTAWRTIFISYLYRVVHQVTPNDREFLKKLQSMAQEHGTFLMGRKQYQFNHNHGLNQTMGLLALGLTFSKLPDHEKWIETGLQRAEEQMRDNVSEEGIHLEQSGFYQLYTLRTFMEIANAAYHSGHPVSQSYMQKLDKMLGIAALYAGNNGIVETVPWHNHTINAFDYLKDVKQLPLSPPTPGRDLYFKIKQGISVPGLFVNPKGGYSFIRGEKNDLDITIHNRFLNSPHFQPDPIGLTVNLGNQRIVTYGNYSSDTRLAKDFNVVQVKGLTIQPVKTQRYLPLNDRLNNQNGEIISSGSHLNLDYITVRNQIYPNISHVRMVARISAHFVLVWDRLLSLEKHEYSQSFHFPVPGQISVKGNQGEVILNHQRLAQFLQLQSDIQTSICSTEIHIDELCSFEVSPNGRKVPTPEINYRSVGKSGEFLWILSTDNREFTTQLQTRKSDNSSEKEITLRGSDKNYKILLRENSALLLK
ncbi:alginate lyase family protein [Anabaena azotica FACHB-119]|uniref:Alginate lyase family protein n=2 Tax=Anabaena azotica TaxID=197653 RepID=A0ABR8DH19_9NOST|nr:alginate lyase family protein [Anabaena azotica FACHB-119]